MGIAPVRKDIQSSDARELAFMFSPCVGKIAESLSFLIDPPDGCCKNIPDSTERVIDAPTTSLSSKPTKWQDYRDDRAGRIGSLSQRVAAPICRQIEGQFSLESLLRWDFFVASRSCRNHRTKPLWVNAGSWHRNGRKRSRHCAT